MQRTLRIMCLRRRTVQTSVHKSFQHLVFILPVAVAAISSVTECV